MRSAVKRRDDDADAEAGTPNATRTRALADGALMLCGAGTVFACALAARSGTVGAVEQRVFESINGLPDWLSAPMQVAQLLGVLGVGPIVAIVALFLGRFRLAIAAVVATAAKLGAERVVWALVQRSRPAVTIANAIVRGDAPTRGLAFVSGHVTLVTALAVVVSPYMPRRLRAIPWAVVAVVAFARVYLGAHAPLDVLGGLGLGALIGGATDLIVRGTRSDANGPPPVA